MYFPVCIGRPAVCGVDFTQLFQDISQKTVIRLGFPKDYNQWP